MRKVNTIGRFVGEIRWFAEEVEMLCRDEVPWANALGAVAVAAITRSPHLGIRLLEGYYSPEEADAVFSLLEDAALLLEDD